MTSKMTKSLLALAVTSAASFNAMAAPEQPNIVMIMLDDASPMDISAYHRGLGAVETPNIDRIAKRGMMVSDYYAQGSSTAGRSAFITGQYPIRTGLTSVGQPGSIRGMQQEDPSLATMLKDKGYDTVHVGKSHLGDRNSMLPTVNGFDEFIGFLYHLNVMEQPEQPEYPKDPNFVGIPRNVLHAVATDKFDKTEDPRFGVVGKQKITDNGPLGAKRMMTIDQEFNDFAIDWINRQQIAIPDKPFFMWYNPARMHQKTHVQNDYLGSSQTTFYYDAVKEVDDQIGVLLDKLEATGEMDNTIVMFTSDNGVNLDHWPDSGAASFRGQKGTTYDGGFRVPMLVSWPAKIPQGEYTDGFMTAEDWVPTLLAAAGEPNIKEKLLKGTKLNGKEYKVHLDGYNQLDMLTKGAPSNRHDFFYYNEDSLNAFRVDEWKVHMRTKEEWVAPVEEAPLGILMNIKADPYEASIDTRGWFLWMKEKTWVLPKLQKHMMQHQKSLKAFPPRQSNGGIGMADKSVVAK